VLQRMLLKRASHAAKNALITSAIAFGHQRGDERGVLLAVAQTYAICTRDSCADGWAGSPLIAVDPVHARRRQLARAEEQLCIAAAALSDFGSNTIGRLLRAASKYADALETQQCWAAANRVRTRGNLDPFRRVIRNRRPGARRQVSISPHNERNLSQGESCVVAQCGHPGRKSRSEA
jgi:hypothetical protein